MLDYVPLDPSISCQLDESSLLHTQMTHFAKLAQQYVGSMQWKKEGAYVCLVRVLPGNVQERLGRRSDATELVFKQFNTAKYEFEVQLNLLGKRYADAERVNKALRVGRTPSILLKLFNALNDAELFNTVVLVGSEALYAFETAAGVRIRSIPLASSRLDLGKRNGSCLQLMVSEPSHIEGVAAVLHNIDVSFVKQTDAHVYTNEFGFQVWLMQNGEHAFGGKHLQETAAFEHIVVDRAGRMGTIRTLTPERFIAYKRWLAKTSSDEFASLEHLGEAEMVEQLALHGRLLRGQLRGGCEHPSSGATLVAT